MALLQQLLPFLLMFVVFYFFFIRPQSNKQKEQNNFLNNLQKGDEVVTMSGIIGRITRIEEQSVQLEIEGKTHLKFLKSSISKEMTDSYRKATPAA
ncbi:MAG: preprotein translocase subunit YajC [Saprospiraceae bacterium]|nr:preprotein translocase subunit YajC [Saprospiraceae bacterium]